MKLLNLVKKDDHAEDTAGTLIDGRLLRQVRTTEWKRLINQVSGLQSRKGFRSLCVTSPRAGEGKTLTSNMLAIGYAQQLGKKVLLLNASLQPTRATVFIERVIGAAAEDGQELTPSSGLLDLVSTAAVETDDMTTKSNDFQLGSYIQHVSQAYDLVIVDSNSTTEVESDQIDPIVIASHCDATIVVCTKHSFSKDVLETMKETFEAQNLTHKVIGLLHNAGGLQ